ncbi:hypothetical protein, partial [Aliiroseovarius marinus]|uniref:hypothetical protein n=1 Tax=Aliiroseovarius marinus TaxID=2500159 RepID=UPI00196A6FAA
RRYRGPILRRPLYQCHFGTKSASIFELDIGRHGGCQTVLGFLRHMARPFSKKVRLIQSRGAIG